MARIGSPGPGSTDPTSTASGRSPLAARVDWLGVLAPVGRRAYSLYLWNWPMTLLFGSLGPMAPLLTVLVAEISYRLLEAPVMHRGPSRRVVVAPPKSALDDPASA